MNCLHIQTVIDVAIPATLPKGNMVQLKTNDY